MKRSRTCGTAAVLVIVGMLSTIAYAELSPRDQAKLDAVKQSLEQASGLYKTKKFEQLGELLQDVEVKIGELKNTPAKDEVEALERRFAAAQRLLKNALDDIPTKPATPVKTTPAKTTPGKAPAGQVSFTRDVAPLFVRSCANCHINGRRGGLSLRSYDDIKRGSTAGAIFTPGRPQGGILIDQLATGGMPQGGNRFSDAEITTIMKWIEQGAIFDGADPTASIGTPGTAPGNAPAPTVAQATGREKVSFMRDIAPVLSAEGCIRCHMGQQGGGNFELDTFNRLIRGTGNSGGMAVTAGNPAGSMIVMKLRGTSKEGGRMPRGRDPLPEETIKKFETWIAEGAKFDGEDPAQSIDFALQIIKARKMTHDELAEWRVDMAMANWAKANPANKPDIVRSTDHTIIGRLPVVKMEEASKVAEGVRTKVAAALKVPTPQPLLKGKLTIFVFDKRFELTEHGRMVDGREPPTDIAAFWRFNEVDGYACVPAPRDGDTSFPAYVAEQFAGAYIESLGKPSNPNARVPRWFAVGSARFIAARVEPKSVAVKQWDDAIALSLSSAGKIDQILQATDLDGAGSALSYALVKFMNAKQNSVRYSQLLELLKRGTPFGNALRQAYGMDAKQLADACF